MGADDLPAAVGAHPGLALPADLVRTRRQKLGIGDAERAPEGRDPLILKRALRVHGAAPDSKRRDLGVSVLSLGVAGTEAHRSWTVPEQAVERRDVVRDQRLLIGLERRW